MYLFLSVELVPIYREHSQLSCLSPTGNWLYLFSFSIVMYSLREILIINSMCMYATPDSHKL